MGSLNGWETQVETSRIPNPPRSQRSIDRGMVKLSEMKKDKDKPAKKKAPSSDKQYMATKGTGDNYQPMASLKNIIDTGLTLGGPAHYGMVQLPDESLLLQFVLRFPSSIGKSR